MYVCTHKISHDQTRKVYSPIVGENTSEVMMQGKMIQMAGLL